MTNFLDTVLKIEYGDYWGSIEKTHRGFRGHLLGIKDVVTYRGTTISQLRENFRKAVDDYQSTCVRVGKIPERTSDNYVSYKR